MDKQTLDKILLILQNKHAFDFSSYQRPMLERRTKQRMEMLGIDQSDTFLNLIKNHDSELEKLIDQYTINVSHFFRNPLTYEHLRKFVLPELLKDKALRNDNTLRIWSAGCACGEEPYSIAILIQEILKQDAYKSLNIQIFASDIDNNALTKAKEAIYPAERLHNIKFGLLNKYFTRENDQYALCRSIKDMVQFSYYNLLEKNSKVPAQSIFGGFDLVLCRNVIIYFNIPAQRTVYQKLYKSLNSNSYLVLGEAEKPAHDLQFKFAKTDQYCKIYHKL